MINIFLILFLSCTNVHKEIEQREKKPHAERISDEWKELARKFNSKKSTLQEKEDAKQAIIKYLSNKELLSKKVLYNDISKSKGDREVHLTWPFVLFQDLKLDDKRDEIFLKLVKYWKEKGQNKLFDFDEKIDSGYLIMHVVKGCKYTTLETFLDTVKPNLNVAALGMTPVLLAMYSRDIDKLKLLLKNGARVHDIDVAYAFWSGNVAVLKLLHENKSIGNKESLLHLDKKFNNMWFIAYGAINNQEDVVEYALAQGSPYYSKQDVRAILAKKIAVTAFTFGAQTALGLVLNGLAMQLVTEFASIFLHMAKEVLSEMLEVKYCTETISYVNVFTSAILKKGTWAKYIYPEDPERLAKLYAAISKVIDKNSKDKSFKEHEKEFKQLKKDIANAKSGKKLDEYDTLIVKYNTLIAQMNPTSKWINTLKCMETLKTMKKATQDIGAKLSEIRCEKCQDGKSEKIYTFTGICRARLIDAINFEKEFVNIGFYLPTLEELKNIAKIKSLEEDGEYILNGTDGYDYRSISVKGGEIQEPTIQGTEHNILNYMDKEQIVNFLFIES